MNSGDLAAIIITIVAVMLVGALVTLGILCAPTYDEQGTLVVAQPPPKARFVGQVDFERLPVDVVFTWCKQTPEWDAERIKHFKPTSSREPRGRNPLTCDNADDCEIHYAVKSVRKFMPWVNKIWVVTQRPQTPGIEGVHVIHHDEIVDDPDVLPTFNSHSIEAFLHKIPGLAEHFIYFNDDCFVGRPVSKSLFYDAFGRPHFYTTGCYDLSVLFKRPVSPYGYRFAWRNLHRLFKRLYKSKVHLQLHQACALSKTVCEEAERELPKLYDAVRKTRLRDMHNIPPIGTALNYGVLRGTAVLRDASDVDHIEVQTDKVDKALVKIVGQKPEMFCINNIPSRDTWERVKDALDVIFT